MNGSGRRSSGESGRGGKDCCLFTKEKYKTVIYLKQMIAKSRENKTVV
jgi:hypothetical protein